MDAAIRIIRYLKSSPGKGLMVSKNNHLKVEGYTDADWAGNISDRKSTSGYFMFVGGNLVTWRSKKQKVLGYGQNIQSDWNINAAEFKKNLSLNPPRITCVS